MIIRLISQTVLWLGGLGALLFLSAGTLDWPAAWVFLAEMVTLSLVYGALLAWHDPALLKERLGPLVQKNQAAADKVLLSCLMILILGWLILMALDAVRFGWSAMPDGLQVLGALWLLLSSWISYRTMRSNSFAAPVVKLQRERGHRVISTGPYRYVRHPMYVGGLFFFLGTPLLLGSCWGLVAALGPVGLLCIRIPIEERTLRAGLEGYDEYASRVRYRLIPLIW